MKIIEKFTTKKGRVVEIVEPTMELLDEILEFVNKLAQEDTFLSFHPGKMITRGEEEKWLQGQIKAIRDGSILLYWAIYNGEIVGAVDIRRGSSVREWHVGTIGLMVDSIFRGEGLGKFLLQYILDRGKAAGIRTAVLGLFSDNEIAHSLYAKIGFIEYGRLPDGFYRKKKFSDHVLMYKNL